MSPAFQIFGVGIYANLPFLTVTDSFVKLKCVNPS